MARWTKAESTYRVLLGVVVVALLAWGSYATLVVSTSPSDQASIINDILGPGNFISGYTGNGTTIRPNTQAQFTILYQTKLNFDAGLGWPYSYAVPGGEGRGWGPFLPTQPSSSFSSLEVEYAVFTFSFDAPGPSPQQGQPGPWFSGPQGNITQPTYRSFALSRSPYPASWILEIDTAGNYTLHYFNAQSANASGRVIMGSSSVFFSRTRPYLYAGLTTLGIATAFTITAGLVSWKKPKEMHAKD